MANEALTKARELTFEATSRMIAGEHPLHYHDAGSGDPLLMLHGSGPGVSAWANFGSSLPRYAALFRTLVLDQPGYGHSYIPVLDRNYFRISADAVERLLDNLEIPKVSIIGNSMGGGTAVRYALDRPDRVSRLVLMGPGGLGLPVLGPVPSEGIKRLLEFNADPTRERLVAWLKTMVYDETLLTEQLIDERLRSALRPGILDFSAAFYASLRDPRLIEPTPMYALAAKVQQPTLLLWGRDDRVVPMENGLVPLRHLPNVEAHFFSQCGHWVMIEQREKFDRVVIEFLTRPEDQPNTGHAT